MENTIRTSASSTSEDTSNIPTATESTESTQELKGSFERASLPQDKVDKMVRDLKKAGMIMSLHPEVNTVYINPQVWEVATLEDKQNMHLFLSSYCVYHCAVKSLMVHIKDGYSEKLLGETDFWDHGLSVKN